MIDRLREQIQERLDQLTGEADRLRKAPRRARPALLQKRPPASSPRASGCPADLPSYAADSEAHDRPGGRASRSRLAAPRRTAPGATKTSVLAALAGGEAMTAGQVADKTGLARPTVSTTLSKLAKTGEVQKAERGYRIARPPHPPSPAK